ncbi:transposase [Cohnella sp. REN36]|uniref:transposase n=1 Tax=Cohnella sp. REN36 TaxID=2887347 RepID=UPI001D143A62|nr:transposase [Cohnella sp. REN36]
MEEQIHSFETSHMTEEACAEALYRAKWPNGFRCPACARRAHYVIRTRRYPLFECLHCSQQTSLIAGTIMEGTRTSLRKWFTAIRLMSLGISAKELMTRIGVTYKTAWLMNHKLRHAMMQANGRLQLSGLVQIQEEIYAGSHFLSSSISHDKDQPIVAGAELQNNGELSALIMRQVGRLFCAWRYPGRAACEHFAAQHVSPAASAVLITPRPSKQRSPALRVVFRQAFRWLSDTFRGIGPKHLQAYLDEFCYRVNLMAGADDHMTPLSKLCASTVTVTYRQLIRRLPFTHPAGLFHTPSQPIVRGRVA